MADEIQKELLVVLKDEIKPAIGCTEPIAIALASAKAYQAIGGKLEEIRIAVSPSFLKSKSAMIPGTNEAGYAMAAVLATIAGAPSLELEVLKYVDEESVIKAKEWMKTGTVGIVMKEGHVGIYVEVVVKTDKGEGRIVIRDTHSKVVKAEVNGKTIYDRGGAEENKKHFNIANLKVIDLIEFVEKVPFDDIKFVLDAATMNRELAQEGLDKSLGLAVGANMFRLLRDNKITDDSITSAQILVASACDARFGGSKNPAMSIAGSGSHGITAILPLAITAERMGVREEKLARAIALSILITIYMKAYSGRLSAFCGCAVTASTGASAGVTYMLGGSSEQVGYAIKNMAANLTGVICDGGNFGCILKTSTGAGTAIREAFLALQGVAIPAGNGIIAESVEETIENVGRISYLGMAETDKVILDIMAKT